MGLFEAQVGESGYVEYRPGNLHVILSVPHGGCLVPQNIPHRDAGGWLNGECVYRHDISKDFENCAVRNKQDVYTKELAILISSELEVATGSRPHLVVNHLHRSKMDANCEIGKACFGDQVAESAWRDFQRFIRVAKASVGGRGLLLDIHGQAHAENFIELGYNLTSIDLNNGIFKLDSSSIKNLALSNDSTSFKDLVIGKSSFGGLLQDLGYKVVPSPAYPCPETRGYYKGGFNTQLHGSKISGLIDAIQLESPRFLRNKDKGPLYAKDLAKVISKFLKLYY